MIGQALANVLLVANDGSLSLCGLRWVTADKFERVHAMAGFMLLASMPSFRIASEGVAVGNIGRCVAYSMCEYVHRFIRVSDTLREQGTGVGDEEACKWRSVISRGARSA